MQEGSIVTPKKETFSEVNLWLAIRCLRLLILNEELMVESITRASEFTDGVGLTFAEYPDIVFGVKYFEELLPPFDIEEAIHKPEVEESLLTFEMSMT